MRNFQRTLLIGATGKLGTHLAKTYNPRIAHTRFEDPAIFWNHYQDIDTVWLGCPCAPKTAIKDVTEKQNALRYKVYEILWMLS